KLVELSSGRSINSRTSIKQKILMPGETKRRQLRNNWQMWGPKGLFSTHAAFEWGVAVLLAPMKLRRGMPSPDKLAQFEQLSISAWFRHVAQDIARLELYDAFYKTGWTIPLARRVRKQLAPAIVQAVTLVWYGAMQEAQS